MAVVVVISFILLIFDYCAVASASNDSLLLITVATEKNDGFLRFMRSADVHGYNVNVLGQGIPWQGGDVMRFPGGGQKVNLLRTEISRLMDVDKNSNLLVMFVDSYDVVLADGPEEVVRAFSKFDAGIVFSAEAFCWPDSNLANLYPPVKQNEKRFLNSGGFIGYLPNIAEMLADEIKDSDDDQLYYTRQFLDDDKRARLKIKLDTRSVIFQNLNGALDEVETKFKGEASYVYNVKTGNTPIVIHGNGPIKVEFNSLTNYLVNNWVPKHGCLSCKENTFKLDLSKEEELPVVFVALFIEYPTAFIEDFFKHFVDQTYTKKRISVFIHYATKFHDSDVSSFNSSYGQFYRSLSIHSPDGGLIEKSARNLALKECEIRKCDYFFSLDADVQLENPQTLQLLIEQNRSVIAPMVTRPGKVWSNFWGALSSDGFYKRSFDYMDIVQYKKIGLWNVPYVVSAYLLQGQFIKRLQGAYSDENLDSDMAFCKKLREMNVFIYADNQATYGHLTDSSNYETSHLHNDLYTIMDNRYTWEKKYIDPEYYTVLYNRTFAELHQPCPDVFWFPLASPTFCRHFIEELEHYGQWSGGGHHDPRLAGGYENVPTVDIHMNQIGLEKQWLYYLREIIAPLSAKAFEGYYTESRAIMNFAVRYRPGEQDHLRPHNDASTYTINVALNQPDIDYQGGGTRFIRYNCTISKSRLGWVLMHPGRLTHHHEGLKVTGGTRYIMISFIDP